MSELAPQPVGSWNNPEHIAYIIGFLRKQREYTRHAIAHNGVPYALASFHASQEVTAREIDYAGMRKVADFAHTVRDRYLRLGIGNLYNNWEKFGDYMMTPRGDRSPRGPEAHYTDISEFAGTLCLATRASEQSIDASFNGISLVIEVDTMPQAVVDSFLEQNQVRRVALQQA